MGLHAEAMDNLSLLSKQRADEHKSKTHDRRTHVINAEDRQLVPRDRTFPRRTSLSRSNPNDAEIGFQPNHTAPVITLEVKPFGLSIKDAIYYRTRIPDKTSTTATISTLEAFKLLHGFRRELSEQLFDKPSPLQSALMTPVGLRGQPELDDIATMALNLFPLLRKCDRAQLTEIAKAVYYYPVAMKNSSLFSQFEAPDSSCFVLSGKVVYSLETPLHDIKSHIIGELGQGSSVAAVDMLFMKPDAGMINIPSIQAEVFKEFRATMAVLRDSSEAPSMHLTSFFPQMLVSYTIAEPSEILSVRRSDFDRLIAPLAYAELKRILDVLNASKVFTGWEYPELIRLTRMGRIQSFKAGDIILEQGARPHFLYFVVSGVCKVSKRPNGTDILIRRLKDAKTKAEQFDLKYAYHHRLRNVLSKAPEEQVPPKLRGVHHITQPELMREQLRSEISKLEAMLSRKANEENSSEGLLEICDLYWPRVFGEACLLDSTTTGVSLGRIHTETNTELFMIHQKQLQTFQIDERTLQNLEKMGIMYPDDESLAKEQEAKREWQMLRKSLVKDITKQAVKLEARGKATRRFVL